MALDNAVEIEKSSATILLTTWQIVGKPMSKTASVISISTGRVKFRTWD